MNDKRNQTKNLTMYAILTAIVVVLQIIAEFMPKIGPCAISFVLVPVVVGGALLGLKAGAWLGFVFSVVVLLCPSTSFFYSVNFLGTVIIVLIKGTLAGLGAAAVYKALEKLNRVFAVILAAIVTPVINTGIFLIGCRLFFFDAVKSLAGDTNVVTYMFVSLAGFNFLFELISNIILSPAIIRVLKIRKK